MLSKKWDPFRKYERQSIMFPLRFCTSLYDTTELGRNIYIRGYFDNFASLMKNLS